VPESLDNQEIPPSRIGRRRSTLVLLLLILAAFATHTYRLEAKSMWIEEGLSLYRAQLDLPGILSNVIMIQDVATHDTHPPLYFILLHFLTGVAGDSEFTFRFLSVAWGVSLVPLMYAFGARLLGRRAGFWAAAIAALSPVYLWYSQETRSYTMLVFLTAFSNYSLLRLWQSARSTDRRARELGLWATGYLLFTVAAVFTHYQALFIVVFQWAVVLSLAIWERRWWLLGLSAGASAFLLPFAPFVVSRLQTGPERGFRFVPLFIMARDLWNGLSMGIAVRLDDVLFLDLLFLVVFVLGLVVAGFGYRKERPGRLLYLLGYLLIPTLALYALSHVKPMYEGVRHLLVVSPPYYLAIAAGLDGLSRRFRYLTIAVALLLLAGVAYSTHNTFFEPQYAKDDLRSAALYLREHLEPGELLVVSEPILWPVWEYYYGPDLPWTALPTYPQKAGEATVQTMTALAHQYEGIWFAYGPTGAPRDDEGLVKSWFDQNLFLIDDLDFHSVNNIVAMAHYLTRAPLLTEAPSMEQTLNTRFGNSLMLLGHSGLPDVIGPGQQVKLTLYWHALEWLEEDYSLSFVLRDNEGSIWSRTDLIPFNGFYQTSHWVPDRMVAETVSIAAPYGSPAGRYSLELSLYSPSTWEQLQVFDGEGQPHETAAHLGTVQLQPTPASLVAEMPIQHRRQEQFGSVTKLVGFDLASGPWPAGDTLHVDLCWHNLVTLNDEYRVVLRLADPMRHTLQEASYALPAGPPDSITRASYDLLIPPRASGMRCSLIVQVQEAANGNCLPIGPPFWPFKAPTLTLADVQITTQARLFERPPIQHQFQAVVGDQTAFLGYDLEGDAARAGDTLELVLYWQALKETESSYTVFVHLLDADGQIRAQGDELPCEGARLTTGWLQGEVVIDRHKMALPDEIPPGRYSLIWGMYDATTGVRLPVSAMDGAALGDSIPGPDVVIAP
jgi:mannosyltransferase